MTPMRKHVGEVLRARRLARGLTMREVSDRSRVSLGYISEIERGRKEASSELLAALSDSIDVPLSQVLRDVAELLAMHEAPAADVVSIAPVAVAANVSAA